jgi:hypothetical protein
MAARIEVAAVVVAVAKRWQRPPIDGEVVVLWCVGWVWWCWCREGWRVGFGGGGGLAPQVLVLVTRMCVVRGDRAGHAPTVAEVGWWRRRLGGPDELPRPPGE